MSALERPKKWIAKAKGWAVSSVFWIGGIVTLVAALSTEAINGNFFLAFVAIGFTAFLATLIHEIGHAWVAKRRGAKVEAIAVLPFVYFPRFRKLTFASERRTGDIGGYVTYSFPEDCGTRKDEIAIAAAGPAWNLISAGLCILALWAAPQIPWQVEAKTEAVAIKADQVVQGAHASRCRPTRKSPNLWKR